jgi:protein-ribulosamine 3-kinase
MSLKRLLSDTLRIPIEDSVSAYLGRTWQVRSAQDMHDAASHPAAVLSDGAYAVFVKLAEGSLAWDRSMQELAGLAYLTQRSGVLTPPGIGTVAVEGGALLILEAVQPVPRERKQWRQMGQALATIHSVKGEQFGFESHNYWGSLYQDNTPHKDWVDFYRARRLAPRLKTAVASGHLPLDVVPRIERLSVRLSALCGPPVAPSLLHGDAHHNNFLTTAHGPFLIDPAVYYGHPEMDLAYVDFFAPVPAAFFTGYQELAPVDQGFSARRDLWRIPAWLAMVEVDGPRHVDALLAALRNYA